MMKKISKKIIAILILAILLVNSTAISSASDTTNGKVGVLMDSYVAQNGTFKLGTSSRFFVVANSAPTGELLQTVQLIQRQFAADNRPSKTPLEIVWGEKHWAKPGDIVVNLSDGMGIAAEGYQLDVSNIATVSASDVNGVLYGLNMFHKYLRANSNNTLAGFVVSDVPDTKERTVMLDCGRKYFTKDWICNFIRQASWMGYNTIELHFSEDGGFRMDFWDPAYYTNGYNPLNDFSWICGSKPQAWVHGDYKNDVDRGKYLTTAEIVEILETAKEYHLDVIPSFDTPAHVDYLTYQFEQNYKNNSNYSFQYNGESYKASDVNGCINYKNKTGFDDDDYNWPHYSALNIENRVAKAFVFQLYTDIANFFKVYAGSTKFNIGADEVALSYSTTWDFSDFPGYVNELDDLLNNLGYKTRIFNDFIGTANTAYTSGSGVTLDSFNSDIEILYWNSPFDPTNNDYYVKEENQVLPVQDFVDNGRTIYNLIVTNTYFCTRITQSGKDARDASNRQWQVYHSNEEDIFNEWYPGSVREHGDYSETASRVPDIPSKQLAGAYFCLWHDYASLATEAAIWSGVNSTGKWNVVDRMWSNILKMWNWDVNNTVNYSEYATIRDDYGYFPGYVTYTGDKALPASIPTSTTTVSQAYLADHSALETALKNKVEQGYYSNESYAAYISVYDVAQTVNANHGATEEEVDNALAALKAAEAALEVKGATLAIRCKTIVNGQEKVIKTIEMGVSNISYVVYMAPVNGYKFSRIENAKFLALPSNDGSGYVSGKLSDSNMVTIWYENVPNTNRLQDLISYEEERGNYTEASWNAYVSALNAAKGFNISNTTMQSDIDKLAATLSDAQSKLVVESETTEIISIEKLSNTVKSGKLMELRITTTTDITSVSVDNKPLTMCVGKVQTLSTGENVKVWFVNFIADEVGTKTYTINAGDESDTVEISIQ